MPLQSNLPGKIRVAIFRQNLRQLLSQSLGSTFIFDSNGQEIVCALTHSGKFAREHKAYKGVLCVKVAKVSGTLHLGPRRTAPTVEASH